jgi:hypothetical protein
MGNGRNPLGRGANVVYGCGHGSVKG